MTEETIIYDTIIIGAGASGLFCSAAMGKLTQRPSKPPISEGYPLICEEGKPPTSGNEHPASGESRRISGGHSISSKHPGSSEYPIPGKRLILEKTERAGTKLLMSGNGQCNITHGGSIKAFPACYGKNGNKIRSCLYKHNNLSLINFLEGNGIPTQTRNDGKVFPASMDAHDVLELLMRKTKENGFEIHYNSAVTQIERLPDAKVQCCDEKIQYRTATSDCDKALHDANTAYNKKALHISDAAHGTPALYGSAAAHDTPAPHEAAASHGASALHGASASDTPLWRVTTNSPGGKTNGEPGKMNGEPNRTGGKPSRTNGKPSKSAEFFSKDSKKTYLTRNLVIASGGCSYPSTGSDGSMFQVLEKSLSMQVSKLRPALSSIQVADYPYGELAGISFENAQVTIIPKKSEKISSSQGEALLFTHKDLSGPAILNLSKYAAQGDILKINYLYPLQYQQAAQRLKAAFHGAKTSASNIIAAEFGLPKRFCQLLSGRAKNSIKNLARNLTGEEFCILSVSGFQKSMATSGGIDLSQINAATMECKEHPGLFVIGEALDVDGITGGYNLQFAYSSAKAAASAILQANAKASF